MHFSFLNPITYGGGKFEQTCNELLGPRRIADTARSFKAMATDKYQFGELLKKFIPNKTDWAGADGKAGGFDIWEASVAEISDDVRDKLTKVFFDNLSSDKPMPMMLKVGSNVDDSHDLIVKKFSHGGYDYIGILMLCPNPAFAQAPHPTGTGG
jgi:hypothetical protein